MVCILIIYNGFGSDFSDFDQGIKNKVPSAKYRGGLSPLDSSKGNKGVKKVW
jgi:hypothetical protein